MLICFLFFRCIRRIVMFQMEAKCSKARYFLYFEKRQKLLLPMDKAVTYILAACFFWSVFSDHIITTLWRVYGFRTYFGMWILTEYTLNNQWGPKGHSQKKTFEGVIFQFLEASIIDRVLKRKIESAAKHMLLLFLLIMTIIIECWKCERRTFLIASRNKKPSTWTILQFFMKNNTFLGIFWLKFLL